MPTSVFSRYIDDLENEPPKVDPAAEVLEWINRKWPKSTIALRDFYRYGPSVVRWDRESAFKLAAALAQRGRLIPLPAHRNDRWLWHVIRDPAQK
jgi:hypothetical protein